MTTLDLTGTPDRSAYQPLGNGKTEWAWRIGGALVSIALAWGTVQREQAKLEEREKNHYEEVMRQVTDMKADIKSDIRELRDDLRSRRR
jgi:hypothetical protein